MIRPEKSQVESIAAFCATGLERAWAENDRLREDCEYFYELAVLRRDEAAALRTQLADCCPELTARKCALLGLFAGVPLGFVLGVLL